MTAVDQAQTEAIRQLVPFETIRIRRDGGD
jgi:hypothetical protein